MRFRNGLLLAMALTVLPATASAQQPPPGCAGGRYDDFDFWVGDWTVTNTAGEMIGRNRIERVSMGCALLENWAAADGSDGHSINFFDGVSGSWHQVWMGANGAALRLSGGSDRPGRMVMTGERVTPQGTVDNRITWTRLDDGTVEQLWEITTDGVTWQTAFRGIYRRK